MFTLVDSIGIATINENAIITGVGNQLRLHTSNTTSLVLLDEGGNDLKLENKIHGIEVDEKAIAPQQLLVYGGREFMVLQCCILNKFRLNYRAETSDWISAAKFINDGKEFVLLTAHSVLLRFSFSGDIWYLLERSSCSDKSTLYCAHLHGITWSELVVIGGNAFGELLIWQPTDGVSSQAVTSSYQLSKVPLLHRISAHNGVIFSIDFDQSTQTLITTSDDRCVRFWRVSGTDNTWINVQLQALTSGYGHVSRVFCGKYVHYGNEMYVITGGEDSYVCVWSSSGELVHKRRQQFGATIWNLIYEPHSATVYTVGSTGNILSLDFKAFVNAKKQTSDMFLSPILTHSHSDSKDYVAKIKFLTSNLLVGVTNSHQLVYMVTNLNGSWQNNAWISVNAEHSHNFKCTVLEVWENNLIAICGYKCLTIFHVETEKLTFNVIYSTRNMKLWNVIRGFQFLNANTCLLSDDVGNCFMLEICQPNEQIKIIDISLPLCKESWLTTALLLKDDNFLLVSNRQGNVFLYKRNLHAFEHVHTLKHPHGNLGATVFQLVENNTDKIFIKSAGRDGTIKLIAVHKRTSRLSLELSENIPVAWVEKAIPIIEDQKDNDNDMMLLGFNDNHFVIWCEAYDFLIQLPCGGGHRFWHYNISKDSTDLAELYIQLAFIQNRCVKYYKQRLFITNGHAHQQLIKLPTPNKWHVRPCNAAVLFKENNTLISAGDDNLIKIFHIRDDKLIEKLKLHAHLSNVRALKLIKDYQSLDSYLLLSGGGRAQLCLHRLHINVDSLKAQLLLTHTIVQQPKQQKNEIDECEKYNFSLDPETRIMAIDAIIAKNDSQLHIFLGCSDGYVRKLCLSGKNYDVVLSPQQELFMGRCVLQTKVIVDYDLILVATTDGILRFYDMNLIDHQQFKLVHHTSGVNCLDVLFTNKELHIVSGGDDQAISYCKLYLACHDKLSVKNEWKLPSACTAQVTAICLSDDAKYVYASGVDQQVLKINLDNGEILDNTTTCVADVKGMCLWQENNTCLIYGSGIQSVELDT